MVEAPEPSPEMTLEHPELAADTPGGASFERYCNALSARHVYWAAVLFGLCNLVFWPTDLLFLEQGGALAGAFPPMRIGFITISLLTALALRLFRQVRRKAPWMLMLALTTGILVAALTVVPTWDAIDSRDLSWFHTGYLTPLVTLTLVLPLWQRALATLILPVLAGLLFYVANPPLVLEGYIGIPLVVWLFVCVASVAVGEVLYRLLSVNFHQRRALAERARELEDSRDGLRATVEWLNTVNEALSVQVRKKAGDLSRLLKRLDQTRVEERRRLSRELEEELNRRFTDLRVEIAVARERVQHRQEMVETLNRLDQLLASSAEAVSGSFDALRPTFDAEAGLVSAIRSLVESIRANRDLTIRLSILPESFQVPEREAEQVYHIFYEALTNAARHSEATDVNITVTYAPGQLSFRIADNGRGPATAEGHPEGPGLAAMRERAAALGGSLAVEGTPGMGTKVEFAVPLVAKV